MILPFHDLQIALELHGVAFQNKKKIRDKIIRNGGEISYIITKKTKFVIANKHCDNYKTRKACQLGIPVVTEEYIHKCDQLRKLLNVFDYLAQDDSNLSKFKKGRIVLPKVNEGKKIVSKKNDFDVDALKWRPFLDTDSAQNYVVYKFFVLFLTHSNEKAYFVMEIHIVNENNKKFYRVLKSVYEVEEEAPILRKQELCITDCLQYAEHIYEYSYEEETKKSQSFKRVYHVPRGYFLGSSALQLWQEEMKCNYGNLHPEVGALVEIIWNGASGLLQKSLKPETLALLTMENILNALAVLSNMRRHLNDAAEFDKLKQKFFSYIPHKLYNDNFSRSKRNIAHKEELCLMLKDFVSVKEVECTSMSLNLYNSVKCSIQYLSPDSLEYHELKSKIEITPGLEICNIFKLAKREDELRFRRNLSNSKELYHSTKQENLASILINGLQLPNVTTDIYGITRSDPGKLGFGLYFTDSVDATVKYSNVSQHSGTRFMLINEVMLGECYKVTTADESLSSAPEGFNSVCGTPSENGDFKYNEFCIYDRHQQIFKYIIEFTLKGDKRNKLSPTLINTLKPTEIHCQIDDINSLALSAIKDPLEDTTLGLVVASKSNESSVELKEVHVKGKLIDCSSEITLFQVYKNKTVNTLEAKYVFPLSDKAAVCGFEAYINNKHVIGKVKEKEQAHREYKKAIEEGHGAYLMDQESANVFTVSIGNIPPHARVVIKITFISELTVEGEHILFQLPGYLANWDKDSVLSTHDATQTTTTMTSVQSKDAKSSLELSVDMPFDITKIESFHHKIITKQTKTKASIRLSKTSNLDGKDFVLKLSVAEIHVPRMWIEKQDTHQANMVTFYPEFEYDPVDNYEAVVVLDMSNSMKSCCLEAKVIASCVIQNFPNSCTFNVYRIGSHYEELYIASKKATKENIDTALKFIGDSQANLGGSTLSHVINSLAFKSTSMVNVFCISDGYFDNKESCLISTKSMKNARIFSMGVGNLIDEHFLKLFSAKSGGFYERFDLKRKSKWLKKVEEQSKKASQPALENPRIKWITHNDTVSDMNQPLESSVCLNAIFKGSRIVAYSFVQDCTQSELNATIGGRDFSLVVSAPELGTLSGDTLHKLTAKALIHDNEYEVLHDDITTHVMLKESQRDSIIGLSINYSVVSRYTSFVAIEERKNEDMSSVIGIGPSIDEILATVSADNLTEIQWDLPNEELNDEQRVVNLLKQIAVTETYSVAQSRELAVEVKQFLEILPKDDPLRIAVTACNLEKNKFPSNTLASVLLDHGKINYNNLKIIIDDTDNLDYPSAITSLAEVAFPKEEFNFLLGIPMNLRPILCACTAHLLKELRENSAYNYGIVGFLQEMYKFASTCFENFDNLVEKFTSFNEVYHKGCKNMITDIVKSRMREKHVQSIMMEHLTLGLSKNPRECAEINEAEEEEVAMFEEEAKQQSDCRVLKLNSDAIWKGMRKKMKKASGRSEQPTLLSVDRLGFDHSRGAGSGAGPAEGFSKSTSAKSTASDELQKFMTDGEIFLQPQSQSNAYLSMEASHKPGMLDYLSSRHVKSRRSAQRNPTGNCGQRMVFNRLQVGGAGPPPPPATISDLYSEGSTEASLFGSKTSAIPKVAAGPPPPPPATFSDLYSEGSTAASLFASETSAIPKVGGGPPPPPPATFSHLYTEGSTAASLFGSKTSAIPKVGGGPPPPPPETFSDLNSEGSTAASLFGSETSAMPKERTMLRQLSKDSHVERKSRRIFAARPIASKLGSPSHSTTYGERSLGSTMFKHSLPFSRLHESGSGTQTSLEPNSLSNNSFQPPSTQSIPTKKKEIQSDILYPSSSWGYSRKQSLPPTQIDFACSKNEYAPPLQGSAFGVPPLDNSSMALPQQFHSQKSLPPMPNISTVLLPTMRPFPPQRTPCEGIEIEESLPSVPDNISMAAQQQQQFHTQHRLPPLRNIDEAMCYSNGVEMDRSSVGESFGQSHCSPTWQTQSDIDTDTANTDFDEVDMIASYFSDDNQEHMPTEQLYHPVVDFNIFTAELSEKELKLYEACPDYLLDKGDIRILILSLLADASTDNKLSDELDTKMDTIYNKGIMSLPANIQKLTKLILKLSMAVVLYRIYLLEANEKIKRQDIVLLDKALLFLKVKDMEYPMLYFTLELGRNWFESALNIMLLNVQ